MRFHLSFSKKIIGDPQFDESIRGLFVAICLDEGKKYQYNKNDFILFF